MTRGNGVLTPDEGAKTPVLLALGDLKVVTGKFWKDGTVLNGVLVKELEVKRGD